MQCTACTVARIFRTLPSSAQADIPSGKLIHLTLHTTLVPEPAAVDVLIPPSYDDLPERIPVPLAEDEMRNDSSRSRQSDTETTHWPVALQR